MAAACVLFAVLSCVFAVQAAPSPLSRDATTSITPLSASQISTYTTYAYFASIAYCQSAAVSSWTCGVNCAGNSDFITTAVGGDGDAVERYYVGYNPPSQEVIVAHQGTNFSLLIPTLTDLDFFLTPLVSNLYPNVPLDVLVHNGFLAAQEKAATTILAAVQSTMATYSTKKVTLIGHSLGAAISLLDSIYLPLHLPHSTIFKTVVFGLPRVGNGAFADYVDSVAHLSHVNNKEDPVPILPPRLLGFVHPDGEVHIQDSGVYDNCPGHDNTSPLCSTGDVLTILQGNTTNHAGPYAGVEMGCSLST
ncbi:lipase class 3 family protein [Athelia psychrophila]|uniref:Lipase class 3 family protein n=1 Tax=Athelia psychrophila TaxID=1759441 RepID=A0A165X9Z7_9AGAM|nr:lipase class 3 family protein [Fibularhizoctonia sp. CBS 109695]